MAFRYLIYRTDFGNTIVRETPTDTSTGGTEQSLFSDFIIPEIQPVYLWRVTGGTDVVPNLDANINDWLESEAPPPDPNDVATVGYVTGLTDQKIDKVTGATGNVGVFTSDGNLEDSTFSISELTGVTSGSTPLSLFTGYTATTETRLGDIETDIATVSGDTQDNAADIVYLSGETDVNSADIAYLSGETDNLAADIAFVSGVTDQNTTDIGVVSGATDANAADITYLSGETDNKIDKVTGATGNVGTFDASGNLVDSGFDISELTGVTSGFTTLEQFTGYTATTEIRLQGIEGDVTYLSGQTDLKLNISDFNAYSASTASDITDIENDISYLSGQTDLKLNISDFNVYSANTQSQITDIENDISYLSGQTDLKLNISDFNSYTGTTDTRLTNIENELANVTGLTSTALTGATNGLTANGQIVELGGALTKDTTISGTTHDFTLNVSDITLQATGSINILDTGGNNVDIETDGGTIDIIGNNGVSVEQTKLTIGPTQMLITDSRGTAVGLQYNADYSANFTARSLIDKAYADAVVSGLDLKESVLAATTSGNTDIDLTGGTFGGTIDGYTVQDGDRILVKNQNSNKEQNGIWVYSSGGNTFGRAIDFDNPNVTSGAFTFVETGSTLASTGWVLVTQDPINVGTTPLTFTQFSAAGAFTGGVGIDISGGVISVDGASLAGNSIAWTGNTFNVDIASGTLATALNSKLDISDFNTYSGNTDTRLDGIEADIVYISGETAGKLDESTFTGYTATTDTRLDDIEADVTYISGVTDTKLDIDIFTGYTASTAVIDERLQLVATGATNINTVAVTEIDWHIAQFSASSFNWSGGSGIFIQETGDYKVSYKIGLNNGSGSAVRSVGAYLILNNSSTIVESAGAATLAGGTNISEAITSPSTILSLSAGDRIDLAGFRIGNAGTVNTVNESVTILIERID